MTVFGIFARLLSAALGSPILFRLPELGCNMLAFEFVTRKLLNEEESRQLGEY
jgi:hypothetical protein